MDAHANGVRRKPARFEPRGLASAHRLRYLHHPLQTRGDTTMVSDSSAGPRDGGAPSTTAGRRGNGRVRFGPAAHEPTPVGNEVTAPSGAVDVATDPAAVLELWERARLLE